MESLPSSIEAYLSDAGFSGTEIVALKKLLEMDAATLRELSLKSGKSTGVLDQAVKKLMNKGIVSKETINDVPKYVMKSLQSILKWMEDDMHTRQQLMVRRHQDFELFINSIVTTKRRPEMEFFEGEDGLKKAYMLLLERGNDFIQYGPALWIPEEDPLRDFRVQYFRERHNRGIFLRAISHDTFLGRRMVSRDPFEYRRTILVDQDAYPFYFEKIIAGDTLACFHLEDNRAVFIKFPEMAANERAFFDRLWNKKIQREQNANRPADPIVADGVKKLHSAQTFVDVDAKVSVPMKTRMFSELREFFLGKKSLAAFAGCAVLAAIGTFGVYQYSFIQSKKEVQNRILLISTTGAMQFDARDVEQVRTPEDMKKPEYLKLVNKLREIRSQNEGVRYAYLMRPSEKVGKVYFVADADAFELEIPKDINYDGIIDEDDVPDFPGDVYSEVKDEHDSFLESTEAAYEKPAVYEPYDDGAWGTVIASWAPIKNADGKTIALLGIDVFADDVFQLSGNVFMPAVIFIALFLIFVFVRLAAFNRSLFKEISAALSLKKLSITVVSCAVVAIAAAALLYYYNVYLTIQRVQVKVLSIAATGGLQFEAEDLNQLRHKEDIQKPEYAKVIYLLNEIRRQNPGVKFMYLMRPTKDPNTLEFVADADSLEPFSYKDFNDNGVVTEEDMIPLPGDPYDITGVVAMHTAINGQNSVDQRPETDQWGTYISGYSPIKNSDGSVAAILGVDIETSSIAELAKQTFAPVLYFLGFFVFVIFIRLASLNRSLLRECYVFCNTRKKMIMTVGVVVGMAVLTIVLYMYNVRANIERVREKVLSIATTGSLQFKAEDLDQLRILKDIEKPVFVKVAKELQDIRLQNANIKYVYLFRPQDGTTTFEFIADADAFNADLNAPTDLDGNGITDEEMDEIPYPGLSYDVTHIEELAKHQYQTPIVTKESYTDQWGSVFSGYAPIRNQSGAIVAILAVDMSANEAYRASLVALIPALILSIGFGLYVIFLRVDFKKSTLYTLLQKVVTRQRMYIVIFILMGVYWLLFGLHFYKKHLLLEETGKRLMAIAVTATSQINPNDLEPLRFARDMKREEYQRVFTQLNEIRKNNPDIRYVYILRPTKDEEVWDFIVDADSNYFIPFLGIDYNDDKKVTELDENVAPGVALWLDPAYNSARESLKQPMYDDEFYANQWGPLLSGYAPIKDRNGKTIAILGLDVSAE